MYSRFQTKSLDPIPDEDQLDRNGLGVDDALATLTETTTAALKKSAADYKRLDDALAKLEAKAGRPGAAANDNVGGPRAANDNKAALGAEHKAFATFLRTGDNTEWKAMSVGDSTQGGYFESPAL